MGFLHSKALPMNSLAMAFLILVPSPPLVQPGAVAPNQAPLEPLNTLYQILDSMVKVIGWCMKWCAHNPQKLRMYDEMMGGINRK